MSLQRSQAQVLQKRGSSGADNEALMLLKFTVNHAAAAACERDIKANIYKSAAFGRERGRQEPVDTAARTK